ncbi:MAG: glycosyltransferase family 39 protein [Chloroflexi bacterium]|nr:glycosyltransferase family 39 protein [Chloroflexota bacterium]
MEEASNCQPKSIGGVSFQAATSDAAHRRPWWHGALSWFTTREGIAVCAMAAVVFGLHLGTLANPPQQMFDEAHYVPEANGFLHGEKINRPEHPPLAKWIIAMSIRVFGDNAVGWRAFSVLFGMAAIFLFYSICVRLIRREEDGNGAPADLSPPMSSWAAGWFNPRTFVPVLATFLFVTENLSFAQASIAMLDVFYLAFMLAAFLFYLRGSYAAAGVLMGLSMLSKAMAVMAVIGLVAHFVVSRRKEILYELKYTFNSLRARKGQRPARSEILSIIQLVVPVVAVWMALLPPLEYAVTHVWENPLGRTWYMFSTHLTLTTVSTTTGIATPPWLWPLVPMGLFYWYTPHYLGWIGWTVWVLIIPSMAFMAYVIVKNRFSGGSLALFTFSWFFGVYLLLIPMELATNRLMYTFYFYPAIGAVCLGIAYGSWHLWRAMRQSKRSRTAFLVGMGVYLIATVVAFMIMSPYGGSLIPTPAG